ncbi:hypothetical protein EUTSA_v10002219mg [Eutrema salsugineum]|uniref:Late embryogenesis abundant protein LEA-2 subgroup domain-containing protein n=1 Tax=Eutrema salsugineum TaxID=72664 RepID=V4NTU6_EUTSA|nr:uncharacterized protein LOC18025400 [Eutrema salsugineum]ESQ50141.1 hypothetical protein EUTSA_v10002219mg [Eutrema salsugineum]
MTKEEAATKKTEAKEEGTTSKHKSISYKDINKKKSVKIIGFIGVLIIIGVASAVMYYANKPPVPRFMLDDLYVDPLSKSSVLVKLSSTNPSSSTLHYSKGSLLVQIEGIFETDRVFLQETSQEPHERTTWTAVVASNKKDEPNGSFQMRNGITNGVVIADLKIYKSSIFKTSLRVRCPVVLNLKDLTSTVSKPMVTCST